MVVEVAVEYDVRRARTEAHAVPAISDIETHVQATYFVQVHINMLGREFPAKLGPASPCAVLVGWHWVGAYANLVCENAESAGEL